MRRRDGNKRRRVERQEQAVERQASYDALDLKDRIARAQARGGRRELARFFGPDLEPEAIGGVRLA